MKLADKVRLWREIDETVGGGLLDAVVSPPNPDAWPVLISELRRARVDFELEPEGTPVVVDAPEGCVCLCIKWCRLLITASVMSPPLEFSLDPREFIDLADLSSSLEFVRFVGGTFGARVDLMPEGGAPILASYDPERDAWGL